MDDAALFDVACGTALNGLARAAHVLDVVAAQDAPDLLLRAEIAPHVFDCAGQIRTVISFAYRMVLPLLGREPVSLPDAADVADLRAQIAAAQATVSAVTTEDFAGVSGVRVQHIAGDAHLDQSSRDYVVDFAVPNMWFHLTMAYATLRMAGVEIGKADFDGLHAYEKGFYFV